MDEDTKWVKRPEYEQAMMRKAPVNEMEASTKKEWGGFCERYGLEELLGQKRMVMLSGLIRGIEKEAYARGRRDENERIKDATWGFITNSDSLSGYQLEKLLEAAQEEGNSGEMSGGAGNRFKSAFGGFGGAG